MGNGVPLSLHDHGSLPERLLDRIDAQVDGSKRTRVSSIAHCVNARGTRRDQRRELTRSVWMRWSAMAIYTGLMPRARPQADGFGHRRPTRIRHETPAGSKIRPS
jgi:hypothetical protein